MGRPWTCEGLGRWGSGWGAGMYTSSTRGWGLGVRGYRLRMVVHVRTCMREYRHVSVAVRSTIVSALTPASLCPSRWRRSLCRSNTIHVCGSLPRDFSQRWGFHSAGRRRVWLPAWGSLSFQEVPSDPTSRLEKGRGIVSCRGVRTQSCSGVPAGAPRSGSSRINARLFKYQYQYQA